MVTSTSKSGIALGYQLFSSLSLSPDYSVLVYRDLTDHSSTCHYVLDEERYWFSALSWMCTRAKNRLALRCTSTFQSQATWSSHLNHKHCFHRCVRTHIISLKAAFQLDYCFSAVLLTQAIMARCFECWSGLRLAG